MSQYLNYYISYNTLTLQEFKWVQENYILYNGLLGHGDITNILACSPTETDYHKPIKIAGLKRQVNGKWKLINKVRI